MAMLLATIAVGATQVAAQGTTTGAVSGTVTDPQGQPVVGAQIQIINRSTGYSTATTTRASGLYFVQGLESGGPYTVRVRRIGFEPGERHDVIVSLSQTTRIDFQLSAAAQRLSGVEIRASGLAAQDISPTKQGVSTQVSDTLISRIPLLNRSFTDLAKLAPQVTRSCKEGSPANSGAYSCGASAGGQYNRFNNFTIDGANQNDRFNLGSSQGIPGGAGGGRVIAPAAVKEFRVLLSPTDVRQANFTGMLFNAVTKAGTNEFSGGATYVFRNEKMSATNYRNTAIEFKQYGFSLGGPIIKDRLHFFVAPEWQKKSSVAAGAFVGGSTAQTGTTLNISTDSINRVIELAKGFGPNFDPGTGGRVNTDNPLTNLFGRMDFRINDVHRLVVRQLINQTENVSFSRNSATFQTSPLNQNTGFRLTSNQFTGKNTNNSTVLQVFSNFASGMSNEIIGGYNTIRDQRIVPQMSPEIGVGVVPVGATGSAATSPTAAITFGTEQFSIGNRANQDILEIQDNVSVPWGEHTFTFGGRFEHSKVYNNFPQGVGGVWVFPNIASMVGCGPTPATTCRPSGYAVAYANSGNPDDIPAVFKANMSSAYIQDQWQHNTLTLTAGLRADMPGIEGRPSENALIAALSAVGGKEMHTSWAPKSRAYFSPRIGVNWNVTGNEDNQFRANLGVFTGPPPFILVANALQNTGLGLVRLSCTSTANNVPTFTIDVNNLPKACAGQQPPAPNRAGTAGINLNDPNFKYPQSLVASAGFDRRLPFNTIATVEWMYRHAINGIRIRNLNLLGPRMVNGQIYTDKNGRVLYADTISASGAVTDIRQRAIISVNGTNFTEDAIFLTNQSKDYNWTLTGQLKKRFSNFLSVTGAYTYNRAYDVQSLTSDRAISNWRNGREYSGREDEDPLTTSVFERRHRILSYGTYTLPWFRRRFPTEINFYYERQSGSPISYTTNQDLNGDGSNTNDPIYVPRSALDQNEIKIGSMTTAGVFTPDNAAAQAFEDFINGQPCLNAQRGQIMKRNSCFTPWQNRFDMSIRQGLPEIPLRGLRDRSAGRASVQLDVINAANALGRIIDHVVPLSKDSTGAPRNRDWGRFNDGTLGVFAQQQILSGNTAGGIARSPGPLNQSMPVYTFNSTVRRDGPFAVVNNLGYLMQLTFRYDF
jgi:hypothetical protein